MSDFNFNEFQSGVHSVIPEMECKTETKYGLPFRRCYLDEDEWNIAFTRDFRERFRIYDKEGHEVFRCEAPANKTESFEAGVAFGQKIKNSAGGTIDTHGVKGNPWVGFDLDGTLATYDHWRGVANIGDPIKPMCDLIRKMHDEGKSVKILTARVAPREDGSHHLARVYIARWCRDNLGFVPPITHEKDALMETLYDDRVKAVEQNTGKVLNMAKFKVGDKVKYVGHKYGAPYGKILTIVKEPDSIGRYIVRWDSDHKGFMAVGSEGFATEAELTAANSLRSRNAVVQKALNATARNGTYEFGKSRLKPSAVEDSLGKTLKIGDKVTDWKGNSGVVVDLGLWAGSKAVVYKTPNGVMMRNGLWVTKGDRFVKANANLMVRNKTVVNFGFLDTVMRLIKEDDPARRIAKVFRMRGGVKSAGGNKWKFPYPQMGVLGAAEYAVKQIGGSIKRLGKEDDVDVAEITGPLHDALSANAQTSVLRETAVNAADKMYPVYSSAGKAFMKKAEAEYARTNFRGSSDFRNLWARLTGELDRIDAIPDDEKDDIEENLHLLAGQVPYRTTNAVVAKAMNARAVCNASYSAALKAIMDAVKPYMDRRMTDDTSWRYPALVISKLRDVCDRAVMSAGRYDGKRPPHRVYDVECVKDGFKFSGNLIVSGLLHRDDPDDVSAFDEYDMILSLGYAGKVTNASRVARNFTPNSEFEVGDVVRFRDSVRSVPHDETYTVVKVSGNNITIKGGRDNGTSVEFKNNLEIA